MAAHSIVRRIQARRIKLAIPSDCATFQDEPVTP